MIWERDVTHKGNLGELEMLVLAALLRLGTTAYGVAVREELDKRAKRQISVGALYTTLARLEDKGLARSRLGEATAERGGRAKRYYDITAEGRAQLERSLSGLSNMVEGLVPWSRKPV